jgi:RNA polymerase sigma-70 factor, ECF subfamily
MIPRDWRIILTLLADSNAPRAKLFSCRVVEKNMARVTATRMAAGLDLEAAYAAHYDRVLGLCRYMLNSPEAAEDAAHEVFLKASQRAETYDPSYPVRNWLLKIASNHCLDLIRRQGTERRLFGLEVDEAPDTPASGPGPLRQLLDGELGERVREALSALPEKYRVPLVLAYYNDFSYAEVGEVLDVGRNTVATLLFRGRQMLRTELLSADFGPTSRRGGSGK